MDKRRNPDPVADFFAEAVTDIRQKLVEEPWFGRRVTGPAQGHDLTTAEQLGWTQRETPSDYWDKLTKGLEAERNQIRDREPERDKELDR